MSQAHALPASTLLEWVHDARTRTLDPGMLRSSTMCFYRNFFQPYRRDIFASFRTCAVS
jgi:hypothetical protein